MSHPLRDHSQWLSLAAILSTTLLATTALLTRGPSCGHDFDFHLVSWLEVARAWHSGLLSPHWVQSANYGAGEPRLIFYPPATWLLGAALGCIVGWKATPWAFTFVCLLGAGLAMRRLAAPWLPRTAATGAACLYIVSPYLLFVAYERTAYGELMAAALLPLFLLVVVCPRPSIAAIAALTTAIWLTNAPAGVMAGYTLLWIALLRLVAERSWAAPLRIASGAGIGLAMAGFYLVPAAYEERWIEIRRAIGPDMRPGDSFLFHHTGHAFHDTVLHTASILACVLLASASMGLVLSREWMRRRSLLWLVTMPPLILLLLVPLSAPLWRYAPKLDYLQFPWRWLLVLSPVAALMIAIALASHARSAWRAGFTVTLCLGSIAICTRSFHQYCDDEDNVGAQVQLMHDGTGQEGTDEYTPRYASNNEICQNMPKVRVLRTSEAEEPSTASEENPEYTADPAAKCEAAVNVTHWGAEHFAVAIDSSAPGFAVLQIMDYPAWKVLRNNVAIAEHPRRDDGLMAIPVSAGHTQIDIQWRATPDVDAGRVLSLLGAAMFGAAWYRERRSARG